MVVTDDRDLAARLGRLRTHGGGKQYHHDEVGWNSRLDAMQAAVLTAKLPRLNEWNSLRGAHASRYADMLQDVGEVICPPTLEGNEHVFHQYTIRASDRDGLLQFLREREIGCGVYYPAPLHVQPCFSDLGYVEGRFPEAEKAAKEVLSLPVFPELTDQQQSRVVEVIKEFYS